MRAATILSVIFVLAACLLRSSDAVTCTADASVAGCIDCTDPTNETDAECIAEAAAEEEETTTTVAPTTTEAATESSTTAASTTAASTATGGNRKRVRVTNMRFAVTRRYRIYRNRSTTARTTNRRNTVRRVNVRNRRRNGNVRVIVG